MNEFGIPCRLLANERAGKSTRVYKEKHLGGQNVCDRSSLGTIEIIYIESELLLSTLLFALRNLGKSKGKNSYKYQCNWRHTCHLTLSYPCKA